eukprot:CAMPEP_0176439114 /NCGR_PEP_ID=MMETSP0127-20121128/19738_1 /TAXON_ID=938130 /ORGANISM="Platyophrya macrostoma, Strain WH" /LENGTH=702 /DNA_ID=CAMNT_0017823297 /DNA_START=17 /DNA_END=2125 /DNA_ORIENTATION=-
MRTVFSEFRKKPQAFTDKLKGLEGGAMANFLNAGGKESSLDAFGSKKPLELMKRFTEQILPKMEQTVEVQLLQDMYNKLEDERLKNELLAAYRRRRVNIANIRPPPEIYRPAKDIPPESFFYPLDIFVPAESVEDDCVGLFATFPEKLVPKYYKQGFPGSYADYQFKACKKLAIQCVKEGVLAINDLRRIQSDRPDQSEYEAVFADCKTPKDFMDVLNNEELFPRVFRDFANTFIDCLPPYRQDPFMDKVFANAFFFDSVTNVLVRQLSHPQLGPHLMKENSRKAIINQLLEHISKNVDKACNPTLIAEMFNYIGEVNFDLGKATGGKTQDKVALNFKKFTKKPRWLPKNMREFGNKKFSGFNSGMLVHGRTGAGKSALLLLTTMWAYRNNWVVLLVPDGHRLVDCRVEPEFQFQWHKKTGLFMQFDLARQLLESFREANAELLAQIPVNMKFFGKFDVAGVHESDPEPVPVTYDPERKLFSNDWEKDIDEDEKIDIREEQREFDITLSQLLPKPKNLLEIADIGINHKVLPIAAICEILEQLYNQEKFPLLVAVDGWSWFFRPTNWPSFRYENDKLLRGRIPPHHMALIRALMRFDGHKMKKGFKLCSSSHFSLHRHTFTPDQIDFGAGYAVELERLPPEIYQLFVNGIRQQRSWREDTNHHNINRVYMETQGNPGETMEYVFKYPRVIDHSYGKSKGIPK